MYSSHTLQLLATFIFNNQEKTPLGIFTVKTDARLTTALYVGVHHLRADAVRSFFTRGMFPKETLQEQVRGQLINPSA